MRKRAGGSLRTGFLLSTAIHLGLGAGTWIKDTPWAKSAQRFSVKPGESGKVTLSKGETRVEVEPGQSPRADVAPPGIVGGQGAVGGEVLHRHRDEQRRRLDRDRPVRRRGMRRARMWSYIAWQSRDFVTERGAPLLIVATLIFVHNFFWSRSVRLIRQVAAMRFDTMSAFPGRRRRSNRPTFWRP